MIDHIFKFADEAGAHAALDPLGYGTTKKSGASWDTSRVVVGGKQVTAEAVWDMTDPQKPVLTKAEQVISGFWVLIGCAVQDPRLDELAACQTIKDRTVKDTKYLAATADAALPTARMDPVFAGSSY